MGGSGNSKDVNPAKQELELEHQREMYDIERRKAEAELKAYEAEVNKMLEDFEREKELDNEKHETAMLEEEEKQEEFRDEMDSPEPRDDRGSRPNDVGEGAGVNENTTYAKNSDGSASAEGAPGSRSSDAENGVTLEVHQDDVDEIPTDTAAEKNAADGEGNPTVTAELGDDGKWTFDIENAPADWFGLSGETDKNGPVGSSGPSTNSPISAELRSKLSFLFNGQESSNSESLDSSGSESKISSNHQDREPLH